MDLKFVVVFAAVMALVKAYPSAVVAPIAVAAKLADSEFDPNPQYSFAYDVQDTLTGDSKSHTETRNGGVVLGQYSVSDPDGTRRVVDYTADPVNGFNAIVSKAPLVKAVPVAPVVARTVAAAPLVAKAVVPAPVTAPFVAAPAAPLVADPAPVVAAASPYAAYTARVAAPVAYSSPYAFSPSFVSPYNPYASIARVSYASPYAVY